MACYFPWYKEGDVAKRPFSCGKCHGCKLEYSRQWAVRCVHESKLHEFNVFVTLTYKDLPVPCSRCTVQFDAGVPSLHYCDFQLFMKRLRETGRKVRFYMGGEYGEENGRPHYHAILFNCWFPDMRYWRQSPAGFKLYRSAELERLWPLGNAEIGMVSFESAAYVARYVMKKVSGDGDLRRQPIVDVETGEVKYRVKEFSRMSLKPGIGKGFLDKFFSDIYPHGTVTINGVQAKAPKYYDKVFRERGYGEYMLLASRRADAGNKYFSETLPHRLDSRSKVASARLGLLKRKS